MIVDEKYLQLSHELLAQLADVVDVSKAVVCLFHSDDPIVTDLLFLAAFLSAILRYKLLKSLDKSLEPFVSMRSYQRIRKG